MTENRLPDDLHKALTEVAGARLAGHTFMLVHSAVPVYREAKSSRAGVWSPLGSGRTLMPSLVDRLIKLGLVEKIADGSTVLIEQTDKRM